MREQELFEIKPQQNVVTTTFEVTNTADEEMEFTSDLKLPEGWKLITPSFPFRLAPKATEIRLVSFFVPRTAMAGKYEISYEIRSSQDPSISDVSRIFVMVLSVSNLQARLLQAPGYVIAGNTYIAHFSIINESNIESMVAIKIQSGQSLPYTVEPETLTLAPGEAKTVTVTVKTSGKITKDFSHNLTLTVQSAKDGKLQVQARSSVNVISRITGDVDRFHRIPAEMTFRGAGQKNEETNIKFQGELAGKGNLDEAGNHQVEFLLRGPDTQKDVSAFGERDRYFAGYKSKGWRLDMQLGDDYYSLSRLTEQSLDGRGIAGKWRVGDFGIHAFYLKTRRTDQEEKETAVQLEYPLSGRYKIGLNLFNKKDETGNTQIASLQGKYAPFEHTSIDFEAAYGKDARRHDTAYRFELYASPPGRGSYRVEYVHAGPDFSGYYRDRDYLSGNFSLPIKKYLTMNATFRQEKDNLDLNPERKSAALSRYGQIGLNYPIKRGTTLSIQLQYRTREDLLGEIEFNDRELTYNIRLGQSLKKLFCNVSAERGETKDNVKNRTSIVGAYEGSCYFTPNPRQNYGSYVRYSTSQDFEASGKKTINTGLNAFFRIAESASVTLRLDSNSVGSNAERHNVDFAYNYLLPNKNKISAHVRQTFYGGNSSQVNETAFIAGYTIPLGLPVGKKKSIGRIEGRVQDQVTGEPIQNAVLLLNNVTAVTDRNGKFIFPALKSGIASLDVDRASIGIKQIPAQKTPIGINIKTGTVESVTIEITKSADFTGSILVYDFAKEGELPKDAAPGEAAKKDAREEGTTELVEAGGLASVLVELKSKTEIWRAMTDLKGRFRFNDIRPGPWTLIVQADKLPEYHYLVQNNFKIEVAPGEKKEMLLKVLPRKRTIQMLEQDVIILEEEKGSSKP